MVKTFVVSLKDIKDEEEFPEIGGLEKACAEEAPQETKSRRPRFSRRHVVKISPNPDYAHSELNLTYYTKDGSFGQIASCANLGIEDPASQIGNSESFNIYFFQKNSGNGAKYFGQLPPEDKNLFYSKTEKYIDSVFEEAGISSIWIDAVGKRKGRMHYSLKICGEKVHGTYTISKLRSYIKGLLKHNPDSKLIIHSYFPKEIGSDHNIRSLSTELVRDYEDRVGTIRWLSKAKKFLKWALQDTNTLVVNVDYQEIAPEKMMQVMVGKEPYDPERVRELGTRDPNYRGSIPIPTAEKQLEARTNLV